MIQVDHVKNVTKEYTAFSDRGVGTINADNGYYESKNDHANEIVVAKWILSLLGGNIILLVESNKMKTCDYLWDGKNGN